ncbi:MAG: hypothetical protein D6714_08085 [Bacteroidetes bacterium]|nr:MAG: hypothetical protein D6714_08085 [Bacteroidota bacterium]
MKQYVMFLLGVLVFVACSGNGDSSDDSGSGTPDIAALEQSAETNPTADNLKALVEAYKSAVAANPDAHDLNSEYLFKAATTLFKMNRFTGAANLLKEALKDHYAGKNTANNILFLGTIYKDKIKNESAAATTYQCFLEAFPNHEKAEAIRKDYGNLPDFETRLKELGARMLNDSTHRIDFHVANDFMNDCELFALILPQNPKAADYLHKAGEAARSVKLFDKAITYYQWIYDRYPNHPKASQSLFLMAFTYDNDKKDYDKARQLYTEFLEKYPNDDFADDTKFLLENLGKNDEEIIQTFDKKQAG